MAYYSSNTKYAKYTVHGASVSTKTIRQNTSSGGTNGWVYLGSYDFTGTSSDYIQVEKDGTLDTTGATLRVNAVRLVPN